MPDNYTIWIVSPPDLVWSHVFDEVAIGLKSAFRELRYDVDIVTDPKQIHGTPIVLGANLAPMYNIKLPKNSIIYNLEQVHPDSRWFKKGYGYEDLLRKYPVWDFSKLNTDALHRLGIKDVVHCGVGYAPELTHISRKKEDIDVLFVGGGDPRRDKIFDEIVGSGVRFHQVFKIFGRERDDFIARGKIHINLHKEPAQLFEIVRVSYLLANKCFVISENGPDKELEAQFKDGLVFCGYDKLVENCLHYLVHPKERKLIAEQGFEIFSKMLQSEFLASALEEHHRLHVKQTKNTANKISITKKSAPRIFVAIASYRDPECQHTVEDLFAKAASPDRVNVGVCLQVDADKEKDCLVDLPQRSSQIRIEQYKWQDSKGANWARDKALAMMDGEEYVLIIDSHMRFEKGWDQILIETLERCPSKKAVLTAYCPNYEPPDKLAVEPDLLMRIRIRSIEVVNSLRVLSLSARHVRIGSRDERLGIYQTPFCIVNCMFFRSSTLKEVPIDPHIHFWGDEMDYSARLWTHGYDIFQPDQNVMYHYWVRADKFHLHHYREHKSPDNLRSLARINHLLGFRVAKTPESLVDIERYGLGDERDLEGLWKFAGIDWEQKTVTEKASEGLWNKAVIGKFQKNKPDGTLPRIFVAIASYRDPDCQLTLKDLFEKAKHPERINVGICWQFSKGDDDCFTEPNGFSKQVRIKKIDATKSQGHGWAASQAQQLWQDEDYVLHIVSSTRFEAGWDEILLSMWAKCNSDKAVLTCYPPEFTPPNNYKRSWIFGMSAKEFNADGILNVAAAPAYEVGLPYPATPIPGAFANQQMLFAPSSVIRDVPCDPHLCSDGEDVVLAARLWTSGYELFHPNLLVLFHGDDAGTRNMYRSDHKDWEKRRERSLARIKHLLGTKLTDDKTILEDIIAYGLGKERSLADYQNYSGVDFAKKRIGKKAPEEKHEPNNEKGQQSNVITLNGDTKINRITGRQPKIFINMASYRDPECQWTVKDIFEKAKHPDRINIGICWQFDADEDQHCFEVVTRPDQVRVIPVDWREAEGVCWARYQTQQLWEGEEYTFMTDSHMRFVPGWDELMIRELDMCESDKPLLSSSPAEYVPPNKLGTKLNPSFRRIKPFMKDGNIRCQAESLDRSPPKPLNGAFVVCNNIFSRSEITPEVPYDPYLYFDQEEITYSARLYTHGWDVFSATKQFLYHFYNTPGSSTRPLHWTDMRKETQEQKDRIAFYYRRGLNRFNHLTRHSFSDDKKILVDIEKYGFGDVRSLDSYEEYTGIDFRKKIASDKALRGRFIKDLDKYRDWPVRVPEIDDVKPPVIKTTVTANVKKAIPKANNVIAGIDEEIIIGKIPKHILPAMLEPGDFIPMFRATDTNDSDRSIEVYAGKFVVLVFLPTSNINSINQFFMELHKCISEAKIKNMWQIFILNDSVENLKEFKKKTGVNHLLWADPDGKIARSFGVVRHGEEVHPTGFILSPNLQILYRHTNMGPGNLAAALVKDCAIELEKYSEKNKQPKIISELPPVLIVPNVLSPELCQKCIDSFRNGYSYEGTVGASKNMAYKPDSKIRTDHIPAGALLEELDYKLSRSFFPEIEKIFGFKVKYREFYKVGLYTGEKKGFFKQHRDNFEAPLGYRRIASTIHLSDEYEGGGLRFPEYGEDIYKPTLGSGIAFSCSTMHEARPVIKGNRFVLVAFLHGDEDEAYRRHYCVSNGEALKIGNHLATLRDYPEISKPRDFFKQWRDENVQINWEGEALEKNASVFMINSIGKHRCKKVFESKSGVIIDDFLPDDLYQKIHLLALEASYENVISGGKTPDGWQINGGVPLRGSVRHDYYPDVDKKMTKTALEEFGEYVLAVQPYVEKFVGKPKQDWEYFSVDPWVYPHGASMYVESGKSADYSGSYIYSLSPTWYMNWGGLLLLADGEHGLTKCIMPRKNRMVFIASDAYRMITRVDEKSGDNVRRTLTGFFHRKKQ